MANDTLSSRKIKDDENSNSKGRLTSGKGVTSSGTESPDTSALRRSSRETSLSKKNLTPEASSLSSKKNMTSETASSKKNMTPSPSSTRKSERLNKQTSKTLPVQKKSERVEKQTVLTPLRRSERGKKLTSPGSSGSKKSDKSLGSSEMKRRKEKKEKSVRQLTMETKEVTDRSEKKDAERVRVGKRRMDARAYKALFKNVKAAGHNKELERIDKSSERYSCNCKVDSSKQVSGVIEGNERRQGDLREIDVASSGEITLEGSNSDGKESAKGTFEAGDCMEVSKIDVMAREISNEFELGLVDCFVKENFNSPESSDYRVEGGIRDTDIGSNKGQKVTSLKRKRNKVDMVTDSAVVASKDTHVSHVSPTGCAEICGTCFKRQRLDSDSIKQKICSCLPNSKEKLNGDLCDATIAKDRRELQANITPELAASCKNCMQQNGFYEEDIPACGRQNICLICKLDGKLLCCNGKGCKSSYHLSCLEPPLENVPLGGWHCAMCVEKKIESGVHSLSEGVESIWDARDVELSNDDELRRQKQYFVKYKGLAHAHNCWVSESELLSEAPFLVAKFNQKNEVIRWKQEWTLPHHLVHRRSLISPKQRNEYFTEHAGKDSDCHYEWLVKWRDLGYEHATWELENASFIKSPEGQCLIRNYENRRNRAKQTSLSSVEKAQKQKKTYPVKLSQLPAGCSAGLDNSLDFVNKLREYWLKGQNAVVFDDQERITNVILFILSLLSDISRPFLIVSTSNMLDLWEECFSRIAPSVDVVVYNGSIEIRKHIRTFEFYEEGGCIMFQALLTSPKVVIEDLNEFESIRWEAMIIDEGHCSKITSHFEQFRMLSTDMRLLLVSGQLKDSVTEYRNMLSLLESCEGLDRSDDLVLDTNENIGSLKEKLLKYVAYGGKPDPSRFMEYWIPVHISDVQLELYCATLLSKSLLLSSLLKNDPVGALRDIVISTQKCCDHPYLVDQSLQSLLIKDLNETEYLDVGVKASGKLQLLDTMLSEMKNKGLRVLILFQSIGGGRDSISIGDILDDFVRQRFGPDSYERIDGNVVPSKKQAALNNFNKLTGRFVFLLETRACLPRVKLSSVDTVIIFHSDWSPVNDLRALQKITIDSKFEQIKVFRLYSCCTVEEKVLILAKQDKTPDGYMQNMRPVTMQLLLMWGASYLFNRLDEFHGCNIPASRSSNVFEKSLLKHVAQEFFTILAQTHEDNDTSEFNIILKVKQNQGTYSTSFPLFGESKNESMEKGPPHIFWTKLLGGKNPRWKYSSGSSQRSRKRVQYFDGLPKKPEAENDIVKKHRKVGNSKVNLSSVKPGLEEGKIVSREKEGTSAHSDTLHLKCDCGSASPLVKNIPESSRELRYSQKSLHLLLTPEIAKLCEVLQLREDVKDVAEQFLEYVMINHRVDREPATILQAFEISLCWTAASLLKQKIDHKESLALAKQHLSFGCKKEEADYIYSMLQCLKKVFLYKMEKLKVAYCPKASELSTKKFSKEQSNARLSESETSDMPKVKVEVEDWSTGQECSDKLDLFKVAQKDISKSIRGIKKKCHKQMAKLLQKQQEETEDIDKRYEEDKAQLENMKKTEAAVIRLYSHGKMQIDKLKILDNDYAKRLEALKHERDMRLEKLEAMYVAAMNKVREREDSWVKAVKCWLEVELSYKQPCNEVGHGEQCLQTVEQENAHDSQKNGIPDSSHISERQNPYKLVNTMPVGEKGVVESSGVHETMPDEVVARSFPLKNVNLQVGPDTEGDELDTIASEKTSIAGLMENREPGNSDNDQDNVIYLNPCSREQILDGAILSMPIEQIQLEVTETISSSDGAEYGIPSVHSSDGQIHDGTRLSCSVEVPGAVANTVSSNDGVENVVPLNSPSFEQHIPDGAASSEEQIPDGATSSMPDREIFVEVPETATGDILAMAHGDASSRDGPENVVPLDPSSVEQLTGGARSCIHGAKVLSLVPESSPGEIVESGNINGEDNEAYAMMSDNAAAIEHDSVGYNVDPTSVQIQITVAQDSPVPSNQVLQDTYYEPTISTGVHDGNGTASEMQISSQVEPSLSHPVDAVASDQSYHAALATEPVVNGVGPEPSSENCTTSQFAQSPMVVIQNHVELSNQAPSQPVAGYPLNPLIDNSTDGLGANALDVMTAAVTSGYSNRSVQNAAPVASRLTRLGPQDPLQNELDKLRKSIDEAVKIHDETKHQLKYDCDQEIEEIVTQIRRKYEIKLQKVEAEFLNRKKELDANENKVLMNKILAEAFRSKCMDLRASSAGMQQEVSTHSQHLAQLLSQRSAHRPSILAGPSSGPSSTALLSLATPATSLQSTSPTVRLHATVPPSQAVHSSSAHISSIPTKPPHISSIGSPTPNYQIGCGIRAPAPHLQPFRPSIPLSSTSLPSSVVLPSPLIPSNPCPSSLSISHRPHIPPLPTYNSGTYNGAHRPEAAVVVPSLANTSTSALDLLRDLLSPSDFGSSVGPTSQPESALQSSMRTNPARTSEAADIVFLSDDD